MKHAALSNVMANKEYSIPAAYVFHTGNVSTAGRVTYYPIYMLMFLQKNKEPEDMIYCPDLSALRQAGI